MIENAKIQAFVQSPRTRKYALWASIFLATVGVLGFLVLPPVVKWVLVKELGQALHRPVAIAGVNINPYALSVTLDDVIVKEREGDETFVEFNRLYLNLESSSLFRRGLVLREIRLVDPKLRIVRLADNRFNFSDLVDEYSARSVGDEPSSPVLFSLNNIQISGGTVEFDDRPAEEKQLVEAIDVSLPFLSNMAYATDVFVEPAFSARINGAPLVIKGKSKPFASSLETEIALDLDGLSLEKFLDYSPVRLPIRMDSGTLDSHLRFVFRQEMGKPSTLQIAGITAIRDLELVDDDKLPLVSFKNLELAIVSADPFARKFDFDHLSIDSPEVHARISRQGKLNWSSLLGPQSDGGKAAVKKSSKSPASVEQKETPPIIWSLKEAKITGGMFALLDESGAQTFKGRADGLNVLASNVSSQPGQAADLTTRFQLNGLGEVSVEGKIVPSPLDADLKLMVKSLDLLPWQPYFAEKLNVAVTRGRVTMDGVARLRHSGVGSQGGLSGGFSGNVAVSDFQAVDKINSADFLRWKSLHIGNVDARLGPDSLAVGEIALSDFFARVIVSPKGKLNLMQIVRDGESGPVEVVSSTQERQGAVDGQAESEGRASVPVESKRQTTLPVRIDKITLQAGNIRFSDNFIKPNYNANLKQIGGRLTGLSSQSGTVATLDLRGRYENVAPLSVKAKINPLSEKPYLDLHGEIKGVELTPFSSYSGKFAGYAIEKGKLLLSVDYKIENDQLQAENNVFLDQLTFGERTESPDATALPVTLAVALLKNRKGEINLDLPISGSLNDPQFSVGGLVVKVIVNLIAKAVTSPFALLGSIFGGGEELSNVVFDDGRAVITSESEKRLENLAKALIERPDLKLEITGRVDPESDRERLKRVRIERKVRTMKREDLTRNNVSSGAEETVEVSAKEYPALLERVYRAEKFTKPRNMIGLVKSLPVEEMEKLIIANSNVEDEELRELADRRGKRVQRWLVEHQVPSERIFLLPGKIGDDEGKKDSETKANRADFSLR